MGRLPLSYPCRRDPIGVALRPARPGDGPATHAVFHAAVHRGAAHLYTAAERAAWAPSPLPPADWEALLLAEITLIAEHRGHVAGFMTLGRDGHLDLAYVAPDKAGQGIGRVLHGAIVQAARGRGLNLLDTNASLVARPFLARMGWRQTARQSTIRNGVALTNFRMELMLGAGQTSK
ncbi:GNAT family acetyltransferase [Rhodovulum bhavnagarense]|uniref:GNAT family acetyltransferase n=1 Tax=Rhodovulum bhavnagarense TaxID=992286 RepID=A0A4R2RFM6_9RHOB|nr:GNAT family N-acetyltransferase [Rhodovulum bhavnagarense]TCP62420.1 GNAT family acetyltransferase [Rhodovulum bhavnagarense]